MGDTWQGTAGVQQGDDGICTVGINGAVDKASNAMSPGVYPTAFVIDTTPPTNGTLAMNSGAAYTSNRTVNLSIYAEDLYAMELMVGNDVSFSGGTWENYSTAKQWNLPVGDGTKTAYIKFRDTAGNESPSVSASIILDTTAPTNQAVLINGGAGSTTNLNVVLTLAAVDANLADMRIANNSFFAGAVWVAFASGTNWQFSGGDGTKTVYAQYRDRAGNLSGTAQGSIIYDTTRPVVASGIGTPDPAKSGEVTVTVSFAEAGSGMDNSASPTVYLTTALGDTRNVSEDSYIGSMWSGMAFIEEGDDGVATIHVAGAQDMAGNVMDTNDAAGTIMVDTIPPTNYLLLVNNGTVFTSNRVVAITNETVGASIVDVASDMAFTNAYTTNYMASFRWTLPLVQGTNGVYARYRDLAGNSCQTGTWFILDTVPPSAPSDNIRGFIWLS